MRTARNRSKNPKIIHYSVPLRQSTQRRSPIIIIIYTISKLNFRPAIIGPRSGDRPAPPRSTAAPNIAARPRVTLYFSLGAGSSLALFTSACTRLAKSLSFSQPPPFNFSLSLFLLPSARPFSIASSPKHQERDGGSVF